MLSFINKLRRFKTDPKRFWKEINKIWKGDDVHIDIALKDHDGRLIPPGELPTYVNEFYCGIGPKLAAEFPDADPPLVIADILHGAGYQDLYDSVNIDYDASKKLCASIQSDKTSGIDHIRTCVVKDFLGAKNELLCHIVNRSLETE